MPPVPRIGSPMKAATAVVLLTEAEIAAGIRHLYEQEREIVEGAGAVGVAAIMAGKVRSSGPMVALISGCNIDMALHRQVINGQRTRFEEMERAA